MSPRRTLEGDAIAPAFANVSPSELQAAGAELFSVAEVVQREPRLARALSDPNYPPSEREALVRGLFGNRVGAVALQALVLTARSRLTGAVAAIVAEGASEALLTAAEHEDALQLMSQQLLFVARVLGEQTPLAWALVDERRDVQERQALLAQVFGQVLDPRVRRLLDLTLALGVPDLARSARHLGERAAARGGRVVAEVSSAVPLDADRQQRLSVALAHVAGSAVELDLAVDPRLVGSMVVRVGGQVIDGSVLHELALAREQLLATA